MSGIAARQINSHFPSIPDIGKKTNIYSCIYDLVFRIKYLVLHLRLRNKHIIQVNCEYLSFLIHYI